MACLFCTMPGGKHDDECPYDEEQEIIEANARLIAGDDTEVFCKVHGITRRWGDMCPGSQLAVLAGLDVEGDECIMCS